MRSTGTLRNPWCALVAAVSLLSAGCARQSAPAHTSARWLAAAELPAFDPDGPPDPLRASLERLLSRGLVECDSSGVVVPGLAESWNCAPDSLAWTFHLRAGLHFTDGEPLTAEHLRQSIIGGLGREDHATRSWLLGAVEGVDRVRLGRPLPTLGIEAPDARTLVLRLVRPDPRLPAKLATAGVSTPFRARNGDWAGAVGCGPYRVLALEGGRLLTLVAAEPVAGRRAGVDTLRVRFASGAPRTRMVLRAQAADLVWPLPPDLLSQPLPAGWTLGSRPAWPTRRLVLVLRADVPPTTRAEVRAALSQAIDHGELLEALAARGTATRRWLPGATRDAEVSLALPTREREAGERAVRTRPESHHVVLAWDADGSGAEVARALQGQWARAGHYADLRSLRGAAAHREALASVAAQAQLVETQALLPDAGDELALWVMPLRGPAVGGVRTGWRTRALDGWLAGEAPLSPPQVDSLQSILVLDRIVLPLGDLPWQWLVRQGAVPPAVQAATGPDWTVAGVPPGGPRKR